MQISSRFTIAIHVIAAIDYFHEDYKVTSEFLASSIQVNPVIVRRILGQLKAADIVTVKRGDGGAFLARPLNEITFYDVFRAVDSIEDGELFHFHENPNEQCPVGRNIHAALDDKLDAVQQAMEAQMKAETMEDVTRDIRLRIAQENQ